MAKKTPSALKEEGKAAAAILTAARKSRHNFALFHGKDDLIFKADKLKNKSAVRQMAKAEGATAKGAVGALEVKGKVVDLIVEDPESTPANFAKTFKKYLSLRGHSMKVRLLSEAGDVIDTGDEDEDGSPQDAALGEDVEDAIAAILKAFDQIKVPYVRAINSAPPEYGKKLREAGARFKQSIDKQQVDIAKKILAALVKAMQKTPSIARVVDVLADKDDPAKLARTDGLVDALIERRDDDPTFRKDAKPEMKELRSALKVALAKVPPPPEAATLLAIKKKLDAAFLEDLAEEGHGPQRHEGAVTKPQLTSRAFSKHDPMTGTTTDGVHGGTHKCGKHATRFKTPGAYVDADEAMRADPAYSTEKAASATRGETRFAVTLTLQQVMGPGYEAELEGVTRLGSNNHPTGTADTVFTGGTLKAIYDVLPDGSVVLVTMYPNPV